MATLAHGLQTLLSFALVLGVLVFVHELGHYLAARWRGVHAEAFSIGFGRALVSWTDRRGTVWKISALPLGGYVRMHGMADPADIEAADRQAIRQGQAFFAKSVLSRAIVVAAGPAANFVLAIVLYTLLFAAFGRSVPLPVVGTVQPGSAAATAGLQPGDRIDAVDGTRIAEFESLRRIVAAEPGRAVTLAITRAGHALTLPVTIGGTAAEGKGAGRLGITSGALRTERVGPAGAVVQGVAQFGEVVGQTVAGIARMVGSGQGTDQVGGLLTIARLSGQQAALGIANLLNFMAVVSINLGLVNLLPIPVLDGGFLLFFLAEALRGRPLPRRAQEFGYRAGFAMIGAIFVLATWNDLAHLGLFHWASGVVGRLASG
jgi:regulator of sigma E protease